VDLVADAAGVDAVDLDPLYSSVDPDALDSLLGPGVHVAFRYAGFEVTVHGDSRRVTVTAAEA
jgi:hypothetical protein